MPGNELFGAEECAHVNEVMETGILFRYNHENIRNNIWKAKTFEKEFADFHGVPYAHMCTSGTTADIICLAATGVGHGDEVIIAPFTYIAPVEAILSIGAIPVFAEIDETLCLSPEGIKKVITPKTKAVLLVHMCGAMADIDPILQICRENNIVLIEDVAQALGGEYKGKRLGTYGDIACYSFDFFKIITAGEGGAVITSNPELYHFADQYADHGHDHVGTNRGAENHPIIGFNYRISELHAAVGLAQFRKIDYILSQQKRNKKFLSDFIAKYPQVTLRTIPDPNGDSSTFLDFMLQSAEQTERFVELANEVGLAGCAYWYKNNYHYFKNWEHIKHLKSPFKYAAHDLPKPQDYATIEFPKSDDIISRLISFQIRIKWEQSDLDAIAQKFDTIFNRL